MKTPVSTENARGEEELLKQGWTKQFLASGSRLQEASASYASIGLEVHLEPAQAKDLACSECQPPQPSATVEGWYVIYSRPRPEAECAGRQDEDLW
jgi:hypothetical protein